MACPVLTTTTTGAQFVWAWDTAVTLPELADGEESPQGWILTSQCQVGADADVVEVAPLSGEALSAVQYLQAPASYYEAARRAVLRRRAMAPGAKPDDFEREEWQTGPRLSRFLGSLTIAPITDLYVLIMALTLGADPQEHYRRVFKAVKDAAGK